ncbi:zinc ribbon domain-containing protein [Streptomyces kebangsaanensis]|uniref:zinc ribbon domain-containing protein n=1 Tax=Streptomyces kebangsaanensis TaxID=864058 RepID=UPI000938894F|nr:zinc ribbon domain-containing protein [Streptomyces kebangsaanensis]
MTDNCPRCLTSTEPQDPAGEPQRYVCRACGHGWTTSRNEAAWAPPADAYATYDDPDAWEAEDPHTEPWWHGWTENNAATPDPTDAEIIAHILARESTTTYTVERADDPTN